jgi:hypothetical protein
MRGQRSFQLLLPMMALVLALPAGAQERPSSEKGQSIPRSAMPPAGMCRIWLKDVAPSQQPAPTDCAAAIRARPQGASVIFGGELKSTPVDANANGASKAARPVNLWELPADYDARQREIARRAMFDQTAKNAMQPASKAVTTTIVTEVTTKTPVGPQTSVPSPSTKVP